MMQLLEAPDRLWDNSVCLHTIYQLSSTDGLILRHRLPAVHLPVTVMSHCCRELHKSPPYSTKSSCRQEARRGAFQPSVCSKGVFGSEEVSYLFLLIP